MEMQQREIFPVSPFKPRKAPHLKVVQLPEKTSVVKGRQSVSLRSGLAALPSESERPVRSARLGLKALAPEHLEGFLNLLHGEALLVGALSYDLGLRLSQLRFLRIRDVNLVARVIELSDGPRRIPESLFDDLKEHVSEKMCGRECRQGESKRDQILFSHEAFEGVLNACASFLAKFPGNVADPKDASEVRISSIGRSRRAEAAPRVRDNLLRVVGWFITKRIARRGGQVESPLGLFDKGPKIVRRARGGGVQSYYLWRAVCSR